MSQSNTLVADPSTSAPHLLPMMSLDTTGSSVYFKITLAFALNAAFNVSIDTSLFKFRVKSTHEPSTTGTLKATPSSLPSNDGITFPTADAAPVDVGIILLTAALPLLDERAHHHHLAHRAI